MTDLNIEVKRLYRLNNAGKLKGFVDIAVANQFLIKGLRIIEGKNGLFVDMPRKQNKNGQWYQAVFALTQEVKDQIYQRVLGAYQE